MSSPQVANLAAKLFALKPSLTVGQVKEAAILVDKDAAGSGNRRGLRLDCFLLVALQRLLDVLDRSLDPRHVEEQAGIALRGHHVLVVDAHLRVVLVGGGQLAVGA